MFSSTGAGYGGHLGATLLIPFLAVFNAVLFCLWIAAIVSLATTGAIFGWVIAGSIPLWVSILILMVFYSMISRPLRHARRAIYFNTERAQLLLVRGVVRDSLDRSIDPGLLVRLHPRAARCTISFSTSRKIDDDVEQHGRIIPSHGCPITPAPGIDARLARRRRGGIDQRLPRHADLMRSGESDILLSASVH